MDDEKTQRYLFFEGVFISRIANEYKNKKDIRQDIKETKFDQLPTEFRDLSSWPQRTTLKCKSCHRKIKNIPLFIPSSIEKVRGVIIITVRVAAFGHFTCMVSYAEKLENNIIARTAVIDGIKYLYKAMTDAEINEIPMSPDVSEIDEYSGGSLTGDMFDNRLDSLIPFNSIQIRQKK